jgi:membrane protein
MFSIAPLLVIVIAVAGLFFGADAVQGAILAQLADLMGEDAAKAVGEMLQHANQPKTGTLATVISTAVLLLGASTVFNELQQSLDSIWRVPERVKESGIWKLLRSRLLTFGMVLAMAFLMTISLLMSTALSTLGKWWGPMFGSWEAVAHAFDLVVSFGLLTVVFAVIYKFMPRATIRWHDVWIGAAVTSLLFTVGKFLIGLYLGKSNVASSFGVFGSLALLMVWVYYSAQIFLYGAEFTWVYANKFGSRKENAGTEKEPEAAKVRPVPPLVVAPAANQPLAIPPRQPGRASLVRRHMPELAVTGALLFGAILGKLAPKGWHSLKAKL